MLSVSLRFVCMSVSVCVYVRVRVCRVFGVCCASVVCGVCLCGVCTVNARGKVLCACLCSVCIVCVCRCVCGVDGVCTVGWCFQVEGMIGGIGNVLFSSCSQTLNG